MNKTQPLPQAEFNPVGQKADPKIDARLEAVTRATVLPDARPLTADTLMALRAMLRPEQQRGCYLVLGMGAINVLFGSPDLHKYVDPVAKHERLLVGDFGTMLGMDINADCYKHPELQRIPRTHVYVMAGDNSTGFGMAVTGPHVKVAVEEVRALRERLAEIDALPFDSILWIENEVPKDVPQQVRADWKFCGLSNTHFPGYTILKCEAAMNPAREELIEAIGMASTKSELLAACAQLREHYPMKRDDTDPALLAEIKGLIDNHVHAIAGATFPLPLTMRLVALMYKEVGPKAYVLIDSEAWAKLVGDSDAMTSIDPCCRISSVLAGHVGVLYGVSIYTDAYYDKEMRSLPKNTMIVMSADGTRGLSVQLA